MDKRIAFAIMFMALAFLVTVQAETSDLENYFEDLGKPLRAGDIIFGAKGTGTAPANTGHVGILVVDKYGNMAVREAMPYNLFELTSNGAQTSFVNSFLLRYDTVCVYRVKTADDDSARKAAQKAETFEGGYNLANWWTGNSWYCSQLVYKAYLDGAGINLDPGFGVIPHSILGKPIAPTYKGRTCWGCCLFISPCDIVKSDIVYKLGCFKGPIFDCSKRNCGC